MSAIVDVNSSSFTTKVRQWRKFRKLSQLDLALSAEVSQRHLSWLETGRSRPSREMVIRLSEVLDVPLRERNVLLQAAGFAPAYRETALDEPVMAPVLDALNHVLLHHEPLPAVVVDREWNVRKLNRAAEALFSVDGGIESLCQRVGADGDEFNLVLATVHPDGLRRHITNWEQVAPMFVRRLKSEADETPDGRLRARFERYIEMAGRWGDGASVPNGLLPILPLEIGFGDVHLSLFSVISTFGTPQDVTADELRIEAFYPTNQATERFFEQLVPTEA